MRRHQLHARCRRGRGAGGRAPRAAALAVQADVADAAQLAALFARVDRELKPPLARPGQQRQRGRPAGARRRDGRARLQRMFAINVFGSFHCAREAVSGAWSTKHGGRGGAIVSISSAAARLGSPETVCRLRRRQGRDRHLHRRPGPEVATEGVRVNAIRPASSRPTSRLRRPARARRAMAPMVPMQRAGSADEVAQAIVWLLSDAASYTTGAILDVRAAGAERPTEESRPAHVSRSHPWPTEGHDDRFPHLCALAVALLAGCASPVEPDELLRHQHRQRQGGDLGGWPAPTRIAKACRQRGRAGGKGWRAYLSTTGATGVNARDRIGSGPVGERQRAWSSPATSPRCAQSNNLSKQTALTEKGEVINGRGDTPNMHDMLTGSTPTAAPWPMTATAPAATGPEAARLGLGRPPRPHRPDRRRRRALLERLAPLARLQPGRAQGDRRHGLFYCFATRNEPRAGGSALPRRSLDSIGAAYGGARSDAD